MRAKSSWGKFREKKGGDEIKVWCLDKLGIAELQDFQLLGVLYFLQRCLVWKLFQKQFFQQKIALAILGKLKVYVFTFLYFKLSQINKF